jgi:hypothetical protein
MANRPVGLCLVAPVTAGQFKTIKDVEVHYSAFNTAFLTPKIARQYNLSRDGYHALLKISILDNAQDRSGSAFRCVHS